ncbi:histidine kinase [Paenibacillus sp. sptzw28]|uniref:sensor histidine kinase n=1 Tax=Paenibacillus sp. sptzw28 TaxID=715179 RepID=UPI001C6DEAF7|nr:histidine kinase [Paenibacillus sp. sptzw28]QYR21034.1 histidine kinase [Paenibacillus sp. sptzw28]
MKERIRLRSLGIYPKLFISFLIVVLPIIGISFAMNESGSRSVREQITASSNSTIGLYMNLLELDLERAISLQREFIDDVNLNNLSTRSEFMTRYEIRSAVNQVQRNLRLLKASGSYIQDARVNIPSLNRSISASAESIEDLPREEYQSLKGTVNSFGSPLYQWKGKLYHVVNYPDVAVLPEGTEPLFQIVVELSVTKLKQGLRQFNTNEGGISFLIGDGWSMAEGNDQSRADLVAAALTDNRRSEGGMIEAEGERYFLSRAASKKLGLTLVKAVPEEQLFGPLRTYRDSFWLLSSISLLVMVLFSYGIYLLIHDPLKRLVTAFKRVEGGQLDISIRHRYQDEFGYLYRQFNGMMKKLDMLVHEVYEKNFRLQLSELRQLQSQINPHFLYNSFYIVYRMAKMRDHDKIMVFTKYLGDYFRFITRSDSDTVSLGQEVDHMRNYIEIQTVRFSRRISVRFDELPDWAKEVQIPRLILQPIVENAYIYALEDKVADGVLHVSFAHSAETVSVVVEDNGDSLTEEKLGELRMRLGDRANHAETTGMLNIYRRLQLMYGNRSGIRVDRSGLGGLLVEIVIPLEPAGQLPPSNPH